MQWGYDWNVWPRDMSMPRVALGHAMELEDAMVAVEKALGDHSSALFGTVDHLPGERLHCRRGRKRDSYVWLTASDAARTPDNGRMPS
jgi:hypothetical protein